MLAAACVAAALGIGVLIARGGPRSAAERPAPTVAPPAADIPTPGSSPSPPADRPVSSGAVSRDGAASEATAQPRPLTGRYLAALVS